MSKKIINLVDKTFGRLKIISYSHQNSRKDSMWNTVCACGKELIIQGSSLRNGNTKSCGCLVKDLRKGGLNRKPMGIAPRNHLLNSYVQSARVRKLSFDLSPEIFESLIKQNCHYCGIAAPSKFLKKQSYSANGIDRIDNTKGYELTNCITCCTICNYAKNTLGYEEFLNWIKMLVAFRSGEKNAA